MEFYSTVLWHMKKEVELSALAQDAVGLDRLSPHTWVIMGNCFSLQKVRPSHKIRPAISNAHIPILLASPKFNLG